jgi:FkbM family methyltransferase
MNVEGESCTEESVFTFIYDIEKAKNVMLKRMPIKYFNTYFGKLKNIGKKEIKFIFDNNKNVIPKYIIETKTFYETPFLEYIRYNNIIDSESVVIDVGAYFGNHSVYFSKILNCKKLFCFEPYKRSFNLLQKNIILNDINNVICFNTAVGNKLGKVRINRVVVNDPGSTSWLYVDDEAGDVKIDTLDNVVSERVDFIKIDVEGMEIMVLGGAENLIMKYNPVIMIEVSKNNNKKFVEWLKLYNYEIIDFWSGKVTKLLRHCV